jgi:hypothetical protein
MLARWSRVRIEDGTVKFFRTSFVIRNGCIMLVINVRERKGGFSFAGDFAGSKGARENVLL